MFQTRCKYSKHVANVSNALRIFKTRFKCFKRVANIQNTLLVFETRCEYWTHVSNISNALLILKTRFKCFKRIVNISTAFYSQRVSDSRKNNTRQVLAPVGTCIVYWAKSKIWDDDAGLQDDISYLVENFPWQLVGFVQQGDRYGQLTESVAVNDIGSYCATRQRVQRGRYYRCDRIPATCFKRVTGWLNQCVLPSVSKMSQKEFYQLASFLHFWCKSSLSSSCLVAEWLERAVWHICPRGPGSKPAAV